MSSGMGDKTIQGKMKCFLCANSLLADKTKGLPMTQMTCILISYSKEGGVM